jgi:hypothetical protein
MTVQESFKSDFLVEFSNRGLNSVLEKIIFKLPPRPLLACKEVNKAWRQIIIFYCQSSNPRIRKIRDDQLEEEWKKKGPIIQKVSLESFGIFQVHCFHMIGDEDHLIVAANVNETKTPKIIILSAKTLEVIKILDVRVSNEFEQEIKMSMDESFLVANVHSTTGNKYSSYFAWQRKNDYSLHPLSMYGMPEFCTMLGHRLAYVPFLQRGLLLVYKGANFFSSDQTTRYEFDEWNLSEKTKQIKKFLSLFSTINKFWYPHRDDSEQITFLKLDFETLRRRLAMKKPGSPEIMLAVKNRNLKPSIVGHCKDYTAVLWQHANVRHLVIYSNETGEEMKRFQMLLGIKPKDSPAIEAEVQFSQHHFALRFK